MESYDFSQIIDRHGTGALKTDALEERYGNPALIPLWVADMDFATPSFIMDALKDRLNHPILGYTIMPKDYWQVVRGWIGDHHGWYPKIEWLTYIPGIVKGIGMVINFFLKDDEKVIIQPPVYHPFRLTPEGNHRQVVFNPLIENEDGSYSMDFEHLEKVASDPKARLLILSNPHNPAGITWSHDTLRRLADICYRNNVIVVSDEIHSDMALFSNRHIPFASVSKEASDISITFGAPSKTFNIAGVVSSYAIVPNEALRIPFYEWLQTNELNDPTLFATISTMAAYKNGEDWRRQMLSYVEDNIRYTEDWFAANIPQIKPIRPHASFLVWLDCRKLELSQPELVDLFVNKAKLALNDGSMFGREGEGFMRLNVGCPRSVLTAAFEQLRAALK